MDVKRFTLGPLETNCYIITCPESNQSVIIDPGGFSEELSSAINETSITAILLTHGHFDHIEGVSTVAEITGAPIMIHALDASMLTYPNHNGSSMIGIDITAPEASAFFSDGEDVTVGESTLSVLHTPGHTQGSVSFVAEDRFVIVGDVLFKLSVGRWDLPGGNYDTLINTLSTIFRPMSDNMVVYPGHGEETTIGYEKKYNPFMQSN